MGRHRRCSGPLGQGDAAGGRALGKSTGISQSIILASGSGEAEQRGPGDAAGGAGWCLGKAQGSPSGSRMLHRLPLLQQAAEVSLLLLPSRDCISEGLQ